MSEIFLLLSKPKVVFLHPFLYLLPFRKFCFQNFENFREDENELKETTFDFEIEKVQF